MFTTRWTLPLLLIFLALGWWWSRIEFSTQSIVCSPAVEIASSGDELPRLACLEELPSNCLEPRRGDQIVIGPDECVVRRDAMTPKARLALGLPLNLNQISVKELMLLEGVGEKVATAIIEFRESLGGFDTLEQLLEVEGIGEKRFEALRPFLLVAKPIENTAKALDLSSDGD